MFLLEAKSFQSRLCIPNWVKKALSEQMGPCWLQSLRAPDTRSNSLQKSGATARFLEIAMSCLINASLLQVASKRQPSESSRFQKNLHPRKFQLLPTLRTLKPFALKQIKNTQMILSGQALRSPFLVTLIPEERRGDKQLPSAVRRSSQGGTFKAPPAASYRARRL